MNSSNQTGLAELSSSAIDNNPIGQVAGASPPGLQEPFIAEDFVLDILATPIIIVKGGIRIIKSFFKLVDNTIVDNGKSGPNVESIVDKAKAFLGDDFLISKPQSGSDLIFRSKDGTKQIRFDVSDPHGLDPHVNIETFKPKNRFPGDRKNFRIENKHAFPKGK